ncbi:hypothetical protein [Rossellomorea yichunensis]|jgi:hypothetical protein|nr:hypothetical protein [Rossellomorea sp. YC4-1]MDT9026525.1 hypothetical protein [Rossellomorea sp. YC4-1]
MTGYYMKEIWTPLKLVGVKIYKTEENRIFLKFFKKARKRIF